MLYDKWENFLNYSALMPEAAEAIANFVKNANEDTPCGSHESGIDGLKISIFNSKTTADYKDSVWETHQQYADIQTLILGSEVNFCRRPEGLTAKTQYDEKADYQLFYSEAADDLKLTLTPERFAIYFPNEAHITSFNTDGTSQPIRKIVFKVHKKLFR